MERHSSIVGYAQTALEGVMAYVMVVVTAICIAFLIPGGGAEITHTGDLIPMSRELTIDGVVAGDRTTIVGVTVSTRPARLLEVVSSIARRGGDLDTTRYLTPASERTSAGGLLRVAAEQHALATVATAIQPGTVVSGSGAQVIYVQPNSVASQAGLQAGDVVVTADGDPIRTERELLERQARALQAHASSLELQVDGQVQPITVAMREPSLSEHGDLQGAFFETRDFDAHFVQMRLGGEFHGSSAGLASALAIYQVQTGARWPNVAVTGALYANGDIQPIGDADLKAATVAKHGYRYMLVPTANIKEVRVVRSNLRVIPVSSFTEAVSTLNALGGS